MCGCGCTLCMHVLCELLRARDVGCCGASRSRTVRLPCNLIPPCCPHKSNYNENPLQLAALSRVGRQLAALQMPGHLFRSSSSRQTSLPCRPRACSGQQWGLGLFIRVWTLRPWEPEGPNLASNGPPTVPMVRTFLQDTPF
jgi:hypothetical protein